MRITVVIPTFNRAHTLNRSLGSVFNQSSAADEIIVVDDGSSDNTENLIQQQFPQVKLIRQSNKGVSAARNTGVMNAQHEWIALLDSDDEWLPHKLETIRNFHSQHSDEVLFHSDEIWVRHGVRVNPMKKHAKHGGSIFHHCLPLCVISPSAAVIHRNVFDQIGLFNENLPACEDYDLWLRLCHRFPVFYINEPLIKKFGGHQDQLSRKFWGMDRFRIQALHALLNQPTLNPEQQQQTINMLIRKLRILLKGAHKHNNRQIAEEYQPLLNYYETLAC